jgi:hypothetical protein
MVVVVGTATACNGIPIDPTALDAAAVVFGFAKSMFRTLIAAVTNIFLTPGHATVP